MPPTQITLTQSIILNNRNTYWNKTQKFLPKSPMALFEKVDLINIAHSIINYLICCKGISANDFKISTCVKLASAKSANIELKQV